MSVEPILVLMDDLFPYLFTLGLVLIIVDFILFMIYCEFIEPFIKEKWKKIKGEGK